MTTFNERTTQRLVAAFKRTRYEYFAAENALNKHLAELNLCKACYVKPRAEGCAGRCYECFDMTRAKFECVDEGVEHGN